MDEINFNNKKFTLIDNSGNGKANSDTLFEFSQNGNLVTADYHGGNIRYGKIIAELRNHELHMLYQCMTTDFELRAGKALAEVSFNENGKIKLKLNWEWLDHDGQKGTSEYIEN